MLKIYDIRFNDYVCLLPNVLSGIVVVGLRRAWISPAAACIALYSEDILGKGRLSGNNYIL